MKHPEKTIVAVLCAATFIIHGGCGMITGSNQEPQITVLSNSSVACVGDISLAIGGAQTKGLKMDRRYRPVKVVFVGGATEPVLTSHQDPSFDEFTVGIESIAGQQILAFIQKEKPWEWTSLESIPFSNHLVLAGDVKEMRWQYSSVYPDEKLASFIQALRILLS